MNERSGRLLELDALRGVCAASVVLYHSSLPFSVMYDDTRSDGVTVANAFKYTPLHAFFAGVPAVVVFFVLSGLVLALPFVAGRGGGYGAFLVKRVLRLWPAYAAGVVLTFILVAAARGHEVSGLSSWFYEKWAEPPTLGAIAGHLTLIGDFDHNPYNPVLWSLVHEMRVSLAFPLLVLATVFLGWKRALPLALLLSLAAVLVRTHIPIGGYLITFKYVPCFVAGILLAAHWRTLVALVQRLSARAAAGVALVALLAYTWQAWATEDRFPGPLAYVASNRITDIAVLTVGAVLIVLLTQRPGGTRRLLLAPVPQFLGRISYSLYLIHVPVLLAVIHLLGNQVRPVLLLPLAWVISIVLADVFQRLIEGPSHRLGRRLARHPAIRRRDRIVAPFTVPDAVVQRTP